MKRLFPRAVPEVLVALVLVAGACTSTTNVKPGAPVLNSLSIIDPATGHHLIDVTPDTPTCAAGAAEGKDCDPGTPVCELDANIACQCIAKDMCDPTIAPDAASTGGTLNCTFPPMSTVLAVFDRLLDATPFSADKPDAPVSGIASLTAKPPTTAKGGATYVSSGATRGLVFTTFFGGPAGPHLTLSGAPALPADATVTFALDKTMVLAKDKKTPFTSTGLIADGVIAFKTSSFTAKVTVPAPAAPMDMGGGATAPMGCPDAGTMTPDVDASAGGVDATTGTDAVVDSGGDAKVDAGTDAAAGTDAGALAEAGTDAASDVAIAADTGVSADSGGTGSTDASVTTPSTDVPADMNMAPITIAFTNPVPKDVADHITMMEDGKPFTDFVLPADASFPTASVAVTPKTAWAAGKTYSITVDADAVDVLMKKLGAPVTASFTMSSN